MVRTFKVMLVALVVLVLAGSAFAFAAGNTVEPSAAGYTGATVSGYDIEAVIYNIDITDPTTVDEITFDIHPTTGTVVAHTVYIQTAASGDWTLCTLAAGTAPLMKATCTTTGLVITDITALNIVASSTDSAHP
jgi:hypothetical protein